MLSKLITILISLSIFISISAQSKGKLVESKNEFWQHIEDAIADYEKKDKDPEMIFQVDLEGINLPTTIDQFQTYWHQPPISQGNTGTCWSFSTTSYFESEVYRLHKKEVKLSERDLNF